MIIAITKFDTNYSEYDASSGSDEESDYGAASGYYTFSRHRKIEERAKHKLRESIQDATGLDISPDVILPLCGKWALQSSKLRSCLQSGEEEKGSTFQKCLKNAAKALQAHPAHSDLSIPGAQGQSELDAICGLGPFKVVDNLDQVTGIQTLRKR